MNSDRDERELAALRRSPDEADAETEMLSRIGEAARARAELVEPPPDLWAKIAAEVAEADDAASSTDMADDVSTDGAAASTDEADDEQLAEVIPLHRRRWVPAAAAAAVVLLGVAVAAGLRSNGSQPQELAVAELAPLVEGVEAGEAILLDDDGVLELDLATTDLDAGDGFLELWLLDPEITQLVSLGEYSGPGIYELPDGVDPDLVPVVDISVEPRDGDPTHSGDSLVRGELTERV